MARRLHQKSFKAEPSAQEELPSTSPMEILSLQQVSTAYVIAHLEEFPSETLALLPLRIRHKLLLSLLPADILQLEQTRVVNGIDMEEIWKEVSQRYDFGFARRQYSKSVQVYRPRLHQRTDPFPEAIETGLEAAGNAQISWKAYILACIYALLLHLQPFPVTNMTDQDSCYHTEFVLDTVSRNFLVLLQLLFCMHFFTLQQIKSSKCFPFVVVQTHSQQAQHRYAHFFNSEIEFQDLLHFLLKKCQIEPPECISIDDRYFVWNQGAVISELKPVIHQFFSRVKESKLLVRWQYTPRSTVDPMVAAHKLSWIFDAMLSCSTPTLQSITITEQVLPYRQGTYICSGTDYQLLKLIIAMLAERFSTPEESTKGIGSLSCLPYLGSLRHIHIVAYSTVIDLAAFCNIMGIIQNQNLVTFSFSGLCFEHGAEHPLPDLPQALGSCFLPVFPPNLTSIIFKDVDNLPLSLLLWLIHKFLYSPANGHQEMVLHCLTIDSKKIPTIKEFEHISSHRLALPHNSLTIIANMETAVFELLSKVPSIFLDRLEIQFYFPTSDPSVQAIEAFVNHPVSQIETRLYSLHLRAYNYSRADFFSTAKRSLVSESLVGLIKSLFSQPDHFPHIELYLYNYSRADFFSTAKRSLVSESLVGLIKALFSQPDHFPHIELYLICKSSAYVYNIHELVTCLYTIWRDKGNGRKLKRVNMQTDSKSLGDTHDTLVAELKLMSNIQCVEVCY